jgi:hypothetical protein
LAGASFARASIVYSIDEDFGGGQLLKGSITTNGLIGSIQSGDIQFWQFQAIGPVTFTIASSESGAVTQCIANPVGCFEATPTALTFDFGNPNANGLLPFSVGASGGIISFSSAPFGGGVVQNITMYSCVPTCVWSYKYFPPEPVVVGLAGAVPEAPTLAFIVAACVAGFAVRRRKLKR